MDLDLENEGQLAMKQLKGTPSLESNSSGSSRSSIWVGHCIVGQAKLTEDSKIMSVRINFSVSIGISQRTVDWRHSTPEYVDNYSSTSYPQVMKWVLLITQCK